MSNSGGTSIFQTLNDMKTQIEGLKDGMGIMQQKYDRKLQQSCKDQRKTFIDNTERDGRIKTRVPTESRGNTRLSHTSTWRARVLENKGQVQEANRSSEGKGRSRTWRSGCCRSINDRTSYELNKFEHVVVFRVLSRGLRHVAVTSHGSPERWAPTDTANR